VLRWIFFRAGSLPDALLIRRIFTGLARRKSGAHARAVLWFGFTNSCAIALRQILKLGFVRVGLAVFMVAYLFLCSSGGGTFIYFQF
jgi:hypothetical protein